MKTRRLVFRGHLPGSNVFSCVERDAYSMWPTFLDAWLAGRSPAREIQLVGVAGRDGDAMARIRVFWLTHDGRWDPSAHRMPALVLPAARALALLRARAPQISPDTIVELYGQGYGSPRFEDLRAMLTTLGVADPRALISPRLTEGIEA